MTYFTCFTPSIYYFICISLLMSNFLYISLSIYLISFLFYLFVLHSLIFSTILFIFYSKKFMPISVYECSTLYMFYSIYFSFNRYFTVYIFYFTYSGIRFTSTESLLCISCLVGLTLICFTLYVPLVMYITSSQCYYICVSL